MTVTTRRTGARILLFLMIAGLIAIVTSPASGFTVKSLDIVVREDNDAVMTFDYDLSIAERFAVFMNIADPAGELAKALESSYRRPVNVTQADAGRVQVTVTGFTKKTVAEGASTIRTPALSFAAAQEILDRYWFAPLVTPDFSPGITRITFPDGYTAEYYDQITIPAISHTFAG